MSRKDYRLIALAIRNLDLPASDRRKVAQGIADALGADNAAFRRSTFLIACEPEYPPKD